MPKHGRLGSSKDQKENYSSRQYDVTKTVSVRFLLHIKILIAVKK